MLRTSTSTSPECNMRRFIPSTIYGSIVKSPSHSASQHPANPRERMKFNVLARVFFCWIDPLFWLGFRRSLNFNDLYERPPEADSSHLLKQFNKHWSMELKRKEYGRSPWLLFVMFKMFWQHHVQQGVLTFIEVSCYIIMSEIIGSLADYFKSDSSSTNVDTRDAYLYALGLVLVSFITVLVGALNYHAAYILGMLTRITMTSAIYQKILRLSQTTIGQKTVGHIINLASNDVHKLELPFLFCHYYWVGPLHAAVVTYLLYLEVQWSAFIATILILLQIPLQLIIAYIASNSRLKGAKMTDKRVKVMNEVISGIRVIKMYTWEYAFSNVVAAIRKNEVYLIAKYFMIQSICVTIDTVTISLIMFSMFSVYSNTPGAQITPRKVFIAFSFISYFRMTLFQMALSILQQAAAVVAGRRIKNFLLLDELIDSRASEMPGESTALHPLTTLSTDDDVTVQGLTASWSMDSNKLTLNNVSFTVSKEKPLLAVIGKVGSGKSTLLQCLLRELPALRGTVIVKGSVGYASQEAWVFSATLRDNILFGLPYEPDRYETVIEACALNKDIKLLPEGDLTLVGERGVTLSGGQKARVNLARAVYRQADVYLLDDPLSAVDAAVSRHLFERCIRGLLSDKIVILVTHQIHYLDQCDTMLGLKEGCIAVYGDTNEVLKNESTIMDLLDDGVKKTHFGSASNIELEKRDDQSVVSDPKVSDYVENDDEEAPETDSESKQLLGDAEFSHKASVPEEERSHGTISTKIYIRYLITGGGYVFTFIVFCLFIVTEGNFVVADWWISDWATCELGIDLNRSTCSLSNNQRIEIYGGLVGSLAVLGGLRTAFFILLMLNAARIMHNKMFARILRAPVLFFDTNPIGRVLNRFSKDIGFLDDELPFYFILYLILLFRFCAIMVVGAVANPYVLIAVVIVCIVSILFRWYYLKTARDIKRLEALSRSPVYSHFSLTLQGLPTIRSYTMQSEAMNLFYKFQDQHTQASYLYIVANRWFGMRIDILSTFFIAAVAFASIPLASSLDAGLVGLTLTYSMSLCGFFQGCIRTGAQVESYMVSAERVMAYGQLETESSLETDPSVVLRPNWPTKGHIKLDNLVYRHSVSGPPVLKGITCEIKSSEKIGIVGRTGAGKSSLIAALFRLAEPAGSIKIDGVEITQLGLHDVRSKMSIIPQDPVLFGASIRYNLDPFERYDDDKIWRALEQVQMKGLVCDLEGKLKGAVSEGGANFSVGQRQLFCLARALLQNNSILILDEATANVDMETDAVIQQVIREEFSSCTVLTVAHRLDTVMDSDRIMILKSGELIEFDVPHILLNQPSSYLSKLVEQTGPNTAQRLKSIALESYNKHDH